MAIICTDAKHDFNVELPGGCLHCKPIPAADDVRADRVLYTQARAVELLAQLRRAQRPGADIMRELGPRWVGGAAAALEGMLFDAGVREINGRPDCEDCQTTGGCRCNEGNR